MSSYLLVFLGGGLGSMARLLVSRMVVAQPGHFPLATFTANVISSLLLGVLLYVFTTMAPEKQGLRLLLAVGFCGGFSTFSTFSFEGFRLLADGHTATAFGYMALSTLVCLAAVAMGWWLIRAITL